MDRRDLARGCAVTVLLLLVMFMLGALVPAMVRWML
jgi:hypothetical protein